jgi:beta-lactamase class A
MKTYRSAVVVITFLFLVIKIGAVSEVDPDLPFSIDDTRIKPLRQLVDKKLQDGLGKQINKNNTWQGLVRRKQMAVGVVDISDPYNARFARLNGDHMMYAASLPKLAILLAASQALEEGSLKETPEIIDDMRNMISRSDNESATRLIDLLGFDKIAATLRDPHYQLYDRKKGGGLWVGKRFAKKGKRYPDPLMGISHGASVTQVCRFYYLLALGKLVNPDRSKQMLDMLEDPEVHHKFVNTLDRIVPDAKLYRKSGTWQQWHADSVLVWGPHWRRYILTAIIEDPGGEQILRDLIPAVEEVLQEKSKQTPKK